MIKKMFDNLYYVYEILYHHVPFFSWLFIKIHEPSVKKEIEFSHISSSDKILHIGCGAIPYTSIIIAKDIGANIVGIDNKSRIVDLANNYLLRKNLKDKIKIEIGDGQNYDVSNFNVIIISYGIDIQDLVLQHVFESVKSGTRIILRRFSEKENDYINSVVKEFSTNSMRLLLTQISILIIKN